MMCVLTSTASILDAYLTFGLKADGHSPRVNVEQRVKS